MRILINSEFLAVRAGSNISPAVGECILDTKKSENFSYAALLEVAKSSRISYPDRIGRKDLLKLIENKLQELPKMNDQTTTQKIAEIVAAGVEAGKDDDTLTFEIYQSCGMSVKGAMKALKEALEAGGHRISGKKRREACQAILVAAEFQPETFADVEKMAGHLMSEVPDTNSAHAHSQIRRYCKEMEIALPKPVKVKKKPLKERICDWIVANPSASDEDVSAYFVDLVGSEKAERFANRYSVIVDVARRVAAA